MICLCPLDSGEPVPDQAIFISTEMARAISKGLSDGKVSLNRKLFPVHLPYEGLLEVDFGEHNHLKIDINKWLSGGMPPQYSGENLEGKSVVVFPSPGLGDQLYLAVAIRALKERYKDMKAVIVRPSISSAEQWYPIIYFEPFYEITGPVVKADEMAGYDFYLNAEHFAHVNEYSGTYPPDFYMKYFFFHETDTIKNRIPAILPVSEMKKTNEKNINAFIRSLRTSGKPLVFVNPVSTGRVRDIPTETLVEFIHLVQSRYSVIVSSFRRPDIESRIENLNYRDVKTTEGLVKGVGDLCLIINSSDYIITSDSGITHLSEAMSRPCGSVFNVVSPEERTGPYKYSESLSVDFTMEGVCKTPCYIHALKDGDLCKGMKHLNEKEQTLLFYDYPPCLANLKGEHLLLLLDALVEKFSPGNNQENT